MKRPIDPLFPIYTVDAFAESPFRGNPAGVCFLMGKQSDEWMQQIAKEMNLSETAFFMQSERGYHLRWFTPATEVELCGHATLATAHIIWETQLVRLEEEILFETLSGDLRARMVNGWIELNFPAEKPEAAALPEGILEGLVCETTPVAVSQNRFDWFLEFEDPAVVETMDPDFRRLRHFDTRGIVVTAPSQNPAYDYVCRFFGPAVGVDEDPVTGSAHCALGPYWSEKMGKGELTGYQASERGGIVQVKMSGDRVLLRGKAVTVMQGVYTGENA